MITTELRLRGIRWIPLSERRVKILLDVDGFSSVLIERVPRTWPPKYAVSLFFFLDEKQTLLLVDLLPEIARITKQLWEERK